MKEREQPARQAFLNVLQLGCGISFSHALFCLFVRVVLTGMGFPAGLFLMYMSEEEAFWMLHCIARGERYLLNGLWSPGFPLLFQCFSQFAALLQKHCPKLSAHLLSQDPPVTPELYATHWFMTLFSYNLPFEVVLRIWDILLAEGPKIIFRLAIFFCKHLEKSIMAEKDFAAILDILKNLHKDVRATNTEKHANAPRK